MSSKEFLYWLIRINIWIIQIVAKYLLLLSSLFTGLPKKQPPIKNVLLLDSATTLASKIRNRQITSEEIVKTYISRIEEIQPILNCVTEKRFEKALEEARKCDELLKSPDAPSAEVLVKTKPFFGVPFSVKECIAVEKMKQTGGLVCRRDKRSETDADCVRFMRQAGAIPLVTTNISELAMWWESSNCIYGTTNNPYNTWYTVGGSSGGEGCLLAAAGSPCGIGSDIGGSIRMPAFFNGIFGHKPSMGVVSREGEFPKPVTAEQDEMCVVGPMSRYAEDLTAMLRVMADKNADLLKLDSKVDTSKLKIYYMEEQEEESLLISPVEPEIKDSMRRAVKHLESAYNVKATRVNISMFKNALPLWFAFMAADPDKGMAYDLTDQKYNLNIGREFVVWLTGRSNHTLAALLTVVFEKLSAAIYKDKAEENNRKLKLEGKKLRQEFQEMLGENGIFLYPTHPTAAPLHKEPLVKPFNFAYTGIINVLGLPSTACPLGLNGNGLPIGIQVVSAIYQDRLCLTVAEELQAAFKGWVSPAVQM